MSRRYVGSEAPYTGNYWEGVVNIQGYGTDNYWSFLNMHPQGYKLGDGSMTIRWGLSTPSIDSLNPLTAKTEEAWKILDLIYEPLIRRDPYYTFELIPWLAESFMPGTYVHPTYGECTKIAFTIQPEAYWSDGTPITTYDVYFTLVELPRILKDRSLMAIGNIWFEIWEDIIDFTLLDPYNFEVLFNCTSIWAVNWISEIPILPAHIWKPIADSGDPDRLYSFAPDPNMIGSGPWRLEEYVADSHILLEANKPGSTVKTNLPNSESKTSPGYWYWSWLYTVEKTDSVFLSKLNPYVTHRFDFTIGNKAEKYSTEVTFSVLLKETKDPYETKWRLDDYKITLSAKVEPSSQFSLGTSFEITPNLYKFQIKAEGRFSPEERYANYTKYLWFTIYEDIVGSNFYDDMNYTAYPYKNYLPTPDFKVDIYDLVIIALAFDSVPGDSRWSPVADLNADYRIDIFDLVLVALKFGWQG
jgi:hypothetical protein